MDVATGIAGTLCVVLGLGHETIGLVWVLPNLTEERVPKTPFGSRAMTVSMIRVTWHIVTVFVIAVGTLLMALAWAEVADPEALMLRWFSVMWLGATAMALTVSIRRTRKLHSLVRLPVPFVWVVIAALCWWAAS